jgi:hypothetical protein
VTGINGPTDVTAAVAGGEVGLSWTDNSINEKGFNIWRKTATTTWWLIGRTEEDVNTYNDKTVEAGEYRYRVCGQGSDICGNSGMVTVPPAP